MTSGLAYPQIVAEADQAYRNRVGWFQNASFGIFVPIGIFTESAGMSNGRPARDFGQWIQSDTGMSPEAYERLASKFGPRKFDAKKTVDFVKESGMDYLVVTAKSYDGFCLWDSAETNFDVGEATSFERDLLAELKAACDKKKIKLGLHYSLVDWNHPSQRSPIALKNTRNKDKDGYLRYVKNQLKELIDRYQPASLHIDGGWVSWWTKEDGIDLYNYLRGLDSKLLISSAILKDETSTRDFVSFDEKFPKSSPRSPWETIFGIDQSVFEDSSDDQEDQRAQLIKKLIASKVSGGNLVIKAAPGPQGVWDKNLIKFFQGVGKWKAYHSPAFDHSAPVRLSPPAGAFIAKKASSSTRNGKLFVYVYKKQPDARLRFDQIFPGDIEVATLEGESLQYENFADGLTIDLFDRPAIKEPIVIQVSYENGYTQKGGPKSQVALPAQPLTAPQSDSSPGSFLSSKGDKPRTQIVLNAKRAKIHGSGMRLREDTITHWMKTDEKLSWEFDNMVPGKYEVEIFYGCKDGEENSTFSVYMNGQKKLTAQTVATGHWTKPKRNGVGEITISDSGKIVCELICEDITATGLFNFGWMRLLKID